MPNTKGCSLGFVSSGFDNSDKINKDWGCTDSYGSDPAYKCNDCSGTGNAYYYLYPQYADFYGWTEPDHSCCISSYEYHLMLRF